MSNQSPAKDDAETKTENRQHNNPQVKGGRNEDFISLVGFGDKIKEKLLAHKEVMVANKRNAAEIEKKGGEGIADNEDFIPFGSSGKPAKAQKILEPIDLSHRSLAPWAIGHRYENDNMTLRLHEEILDFCTYVSPTREEERIREDLVDRLKKVVEEMWPDAQLKVFGSFLTKLYLPFSDMDMVVFGAKPKGNESVLDTLANRLRDDGIGEKIQVIGKARIPIIKLVDVETQIHCDICFDQTSGIESAKYINNLKQELTQLRPLTLVLKYFLACRELNETYSGGVGSFLLQLMLAAYLKLHPCRSHAFSATESKKRGRQHESESCDSSLNLGVLLIGFFQLYGHDLNCQYVGVSPKGSGSYFKKVDRGFYNEQRSHLLAVQDPLDDAHDVGANSWGIQRVRRAFRFSTMQLTAGGGAKSFSLLVRIMSLTKELLTFRPPHDQGDNPPVPKSESDYNRKPKKKVLDQKQKRRKRKKKNA